MAAVKDDVIWYKKAKKEKLEKPVAPAVIISAGVITLNKAVTIFGADDKIILGVVKGRTKKLVLRAATEGDDYTPFRCILTKKGDRSVRCQPFIQDVLMGELKMEFPNKQRHKFDATIDEENRMVTVLLK